MEPSDQLQTSIGRVVGINLLVLVGANVLALAFATTQGLDDEGTFAALNIVIVLAHFVLALASGLVLVFFARFRTVGLGMLLGALAVLLIGFSFCLGGVWLLNAM